jgi:hypothetical protein
VMSYVCVQVTMFEGGEEEGSGVDLGDGQDLDLAQDAMSADDFFPIFSYILVRMSARAVRVW